MENCLGRLIVIIAVLVVVALGFRFVPAGVYCGFAILGFGTFFVLDRLFSAPLIPHLPWIMWVLWGAVIGLACAFWTLAPVYGLRQQRRLILATPCVLMVIVAVVSFLL